MTAAGPTAAPAVPDAFRRLMARWATGVAVVTSRGPGGDVGLTVNALLSVSLQPPLFLVSLTAEADTTPVIRSSGFFAASFLAADQRPVSERFARTAPPAEKFEGVPGHRGATGALLLDGATGHVECRVRSVTPAGDHLLIVGEVVAVEPGRDALPLLFFRRGYAAAEPPDRLVVPTERGPGTPV